MKRTKLFLSILVLLAVGITGWCVINNQEQKENDNFSENLEALTLPPEESGGSEGSETIPRYKNHTDRTTFSQTKIETRKDSSGFTINIEYKRECVSYYTYCKDGGKKDICYTSQNREVVICPEWETK